MTCSTKDFVEELINLGFEGLFKPMITIQLKLYCAGPLVADIVAEVVGQSR